METNPKQQRQHFYRDYASGQWSMSELCDRYPISRPTGYKWVDRIEAEVRGARGGTFPFDRQPQADAPWMQPEQSRRTYDHWIREAIVESGNRDSRRLRLLLPELEIPQSTIRRSARG